MSTTKRPTAAQRAKEAARQERREARWRRERRRTTILAAVILALGAALAAVLIVRAQRDHGEPPASVLVPGAEYAESKDWTLTADTNMGQIVLTLDGAHAPQATSVLLALNQDGYFDQTDCDSVSTVDPFVVECGDPTGTGAGGPPYRFGPIENAPADDVYPAGSVVMARDADDASSMGSRFYVVYEDSHLPSDAAGGYTVVGHVTQGLDIVRSVAEGGTITGASEGRPAQSLILTKVTTS